MMIKGLHHVSAITANAKKNLEFYRNVLGMRLIKKTVNQDDTSVYHLFYGDEVGNPGTELTFFEIPLAGHTYAGTNSISEVGLRVPNDEALIFWQKRLEEHGVEQSPVTEKFGRNVLSFKDPEGLQINLVSDETNEGVAGGTPWKKSPVAIQQSIIGLGPIHLTVPSAAPTVKVLTDLMGFREALSDDPNLLRFETGEGGTGAEVHLHVNSDLPRERPGRGSVHHVAFRVHDEAELEQWAEKVQAAGLMNSGIVERYYFKALYFREPNHILFEISTDGPGFAQDEDPEHLGEALALPPFLEPQREQIESKLKPI